MRDAMRRAPTSLRALSLWVLAPLVLSLLYALAWPLLVRKPTAADVVPRGAVLAHRFRTMAVVDRSFWWLGREGSARPADRLGATRNVPGLPGVDREAPFHWVLLPHEGLPDATMAVFALADPDAFRRAFLDPGLLDLGHVRHAMHLEIAGRFAGVARDREAIRHLGSAGLTIEDRGEDHALVADVPGVLRHALFAATAPPWQPILAALGFAGEAPFAVGADGVPVGFGVPAGRVFRVLEAWGTLRAWFFAGGGRITVEATPRAEGPSPLRDLLARAAAAGGEAWVPPGLPPRAKAWAWVPTGEARDALARILHDAGVELPAEATAPAGAAGGLLLWGEPVVEAPGAWTLGLAAPAGGLPDLAPWVPGWPGGAEGVEMPAGAAPLTVYDLANRRPSPKGRAVAARHEKAEVAAVGADAASMAATRLPRAPDFRAPPPPTPADRLLLQFHADEPRLQKLLGPELEARGLFAVLGGGGVEGAVFTDGARIRIDLVRVGP